MDVKVVEKLMVLMKTHQIQKLTVKEKEFEIALEQGGTVVAHHAAPIHIAAPQPIAASPVPSTPSTTAAPAQETTGVFVTSPIVGTFYGSPSPQDPSFVKIGDRVTADSVVCIIEAMKVMNEVKAGVAGVVSEIFVKNGDPVEFGTKMLRIT